MQTEFLTQTATRTQPDYEQAVTNPPARSDEELLVSYGETGNRDAFEELVHRYERELYGYLRRCLGDAQLAEDAFQATFLQVHLKCRQFAPGRCLRPWLYTIAAHQAVDLLRRNRRHKAVSLSTAAGDGGADDQRQPLGSVLETEEADPGEHLNRTEDREWTRLALERLPAKIREVLVLIVYKGLSYREAAESLGIPLGTVKSRMNSALPGLRKALIATKHNVSTNRPQSSLSWGV
jgi:RNA polymerase sigma-70 factor, ECF subfamily